MGIILIVGAVFVASSDLLYGAQDNEAIPDSTKISYYNYKTKKYESLAQPPTDYREYIPQSEIHQNLYTLYIKMGFTPAKSALKILEQMHKIYEKKNDVKRK